MRSRRVVCPSVLLVALCVGCNSNAPEIAKLNQELTASRDENAKLKSQVDELLHGEDRLISLIREDVAKKNYVGAMANLTLLASKHPGASGHSELKQLKEVVEDQLAKQKQAALVQERERKRLANLSNMGMWKVDTFVDEFGAPSSNQLIENKESIEGTFSNTATQDSPLRVELVIYPDRAKFSKRASLNFAIRLYEYGGDNPVKAISSESYDVLVRDSRGNKYRLNAVNYSDRLLFQAGTEDGNSMRRILSRGGKVAFHIVESDNETTIYDFELADCSYLENAVALASEPKRQRS